jgi:2-amino-4-hydroxy-6-hydroxymethyldihydropteridine diphosphokinase
VKIQGGNCKLIIIIIRGDCPMVIIALGSNLPSKFGSPKSTIQKAIQELRAAGIRTIRTSNLYDTAAHGYIPQPNFVNAAITVHTTLPVGSLLQVMEQIEAEAGRRKKKSERTACFLWKPRALDLDIVSYKGLVCNWNARRPCENKRVILPHPRAHKRAFVLRPLADIAPEWHHPVFGLTAEQLLKRPAARDTGKIINSESFYD